MSEFVIEGGRRLYGECSVGGAKNSALPILAATIMCGGTSVIHNCPVLSDVEATFTILRHLGCDVSRKGHDVTVDGSNVSGFEIPEALMREMRSSVIFLGAILARTGKARLSSPGGCEIGLRPIDLHLSAMEKLGAKISEDRGSIFCEAQNGLKGADITLSFPSVGATENIMIAACAAKGITTVVNAAREPEISDLADFLNACGAKISGAGEGTMTIEGVDGLVGTEHTVIPDRIVAGTLMACTAVTGGRVKIDNIIPAHLGQMTDVFRESGCHIVTEDKSLLIEGPKRLRRVKQIRTMPYPGFPTDIQAPIAAMLTVAQGTSVIIETIFENRYKYIGELQRLGAKISVDGRMAVIEGTERLFGAGVLTPDLRGGAALVVAALRAEGRTRIAGIKHIERGYEALDETLKSLGAEIRRADENGQS